MTDPEIRYEDYFPDPDDQPENDDYAAYFPAHATQENQ